MILALTELPPIVPRPRLEAASSDLIRRKRIVSMKAETTNLPRFSSCMNLQH